MSTTRVALAVSLLFLADCQCAAPPGLQRVTRTLSAAPTALVFGNVIVGNEATQNVTLINSGDAAVSLFNAKLTGDDGFTATAPSEIPAGSSAAIEVTFQPLNAGTPHAVLTWDTNAENLEHLEITVSGSGELLPTCDDGNPCTLDQYDTGLRSCVSTNVDASCDDGNACTRDDACAQGTCRGIGVVCDDQDLCTRDACSPSSGCQAFPDLSVCDDHDPCTAELCDRVLGCSHVHAPDGTPCAPPEGCATQHACSNGQCAAFPIPEGFPCSDGNVCTLADHCVMGTCVGQPTTVEPAVLGTLEAFGVPRSSGVLLEGKRAVLVDMPDLANWQLPQPPNARRPVMHVVALKDGDLELTGSALLEAWTEEPPVLVAVDDHTVAALHYGLELSVWDVPLQGPPTRLATVPVENGNPAAQNQPSVLVKDHVMYWCAGSLALADLHDVASPVVVSQAGVADDRRCWGVLDGGDGALWTFGNAQGPGTSFQRYGLEDPLHPTQAAAIPGDTSWGPTSNGSVMALMKWGMEHATVRLVSAATMETLGVLDIGSNINAVGYPNITTRLDGHILTVNTGPRLLSWDVGNPAMPVALPSLQDPVGRGENAGMLYTLGKLVMVRGTSSPAFFERLVDGSLARRTGNAHGMFRHVQVGSQQVDVVSEVATHRILQVGNGLQFGPGGALVTPGALVRAQWDDAVVTPVGTGTLSWVDASHPPQVGQGTAVFNGDAQRALWTSPTALFAVRFAAFEMGVVVERYATGQAFSATGVPWVASATLVIPGLEQAQAYRVVMGGSAHQDMAVLGVATSVGGDQLVVVKATGTALVAGPLTSVGEGWAVRAVAAEGARALSVEEGVEGSRAHLWSIHPGTSALVSQGSVAVTRGEQVVFFDGTNALLATEEGLAFVDVGLASPTLRGTLALPQQVLHVASSGDRLYVATPTTLSLVSPPCPLPPAP